MPPFVEFITRILSALTVSGDALIIVLLIALAVKKFGGVGVFAKNLSGFFGKRAILLSFVVALSSAAGSLFYSEIANFPPCILCWWQRIFLYPQVFIFGLALFKKNTGARVCGLALSVCGGAIALYHSYIQFGGLQFVPCDASGISVPCVQRFFLEYGYVTIPTMALTAFFLIIVLLLSANEVGS